jgi:hypothetical protein
VLGARPTSTKAPHTHRPLLLLSSGGHGRGLLGAPARHATPAPAAGLWPKRPFHSTATEWPSTACNPIWRSQSAGVPPQNVKSSISSQYQFLLVCPHPSSVFVGWCFWVLAWYNAWVSGCSFTSFLYLCPSQMLCLQDDNKKLSGRRIEISDLFKSCEELCAESKMCTVAGKTGSTDTIPAWRHS